MKYDIIGYIHGHADELEGNYTGDDLIDNI